MFEIYQTESAIMLKLGHGHGGNGDGIRKIKIKLFEPCEVFGCFIQCRKGWVVRSKSYKIVR